MLQKRFDRLSQPLRSACGKHCTDSTASDSLDSTSPETTQSSRKYLRQQKTIPEKHKTEMCKSYSELGSCRYGQKCRFAHGAHQLKKVNVGNENYRTRPCKNWEGGECKYGIRCQFGHQQPLGWQAKASMAGLIALLDIREDDLPLECSRLLKLLDN